MIQAIIFDLDDTLVQSEKMKARSYAIAVQGLRGLSEPDSGAIEAYRAIVGASKGRGVPPYHGAAIPGAGSETAHDKVRRLGALGGAERHASCHL